MITKDLENYTHIVGIISMIAKFHSLNRSHSNACTMKEKIQSIFSYVCGHTFKCSYLKSKITQLEKFQVNEEQEK